MNVLEREQQSLVAALGEYTPSFYDAPNRKWHGDHLQFNPYTRTYSLMTYDEFKNMSFIQYAINSFLGLFLTPSELASQLVYTVSNGNFTQFCSESREPEYNALKQIKDRMTTVNKTKKTWARFFYKLLFDEGNVERDFTSVLRTVATQKVLKESKKPHTQYGTII